MKQRKQNRGGLQSSLLTALLLFALPAIVAVAGVEDQTAREYKIKSAFVYQFTKFVEWPSPVGAGRNSSKFIISLVGDSPILPYLKEVAVGRTAGAKPIEILNPKSTHELLPSDIVILATSVPKECSEILNKTKRMGALTVGVSPDFENTEVMIVFISEDNHVRFKINRQAAENEGLKIGSQLMRLGHPVK